MTFHEKDAFTYQTEMWCWIQDQKKKLQKCFPKLSKGWKSRGVPFPCSCWSCCFLCWGSRSGSGWFEVNPRESAAPVTKRCVDGCGLGVKRPAVCQRGGGAASLSAAHLNTRRWLAGAFVGGDSDRGVARFAGRGEPPQDGAILQD